ncbi:MAG: ThuA domain-containing protein [Planctomycetota bacterium]
MHGSLSCVVALALVVAVAGSARGVEDIADHRKKQIRKACPDEPRVQPKQPRKVLIWSTPDHLYRKDPHKGYCVPYGLYAMKALGETSGAYEPVASVDLAMFLPDRIQQFDAIVMNNSCGAWITPTDEQMRQPAFRKLGDDKKTVEAALRQSLLDWLAGGKGIVAYHFAIAANRQWPAFAELIGGKFIGHPWNEEIGIDVEEPAHPLVAAFGGKDFRLADEIYQYGKPYDRRKLRVLLSVDVPRTNMGVKWIRWDERSDYDFALAWVKAYGKGRVFYTSFGHRAQLYSNPQVMQFYLDAIQFATGDLEAPVEPRPDIPEKTGPGPTPPEVRAARMKARKVRAPNPQELEAIEAACPDAPPAKPAKPRKVLVWGHPWTHVPNAFAEEALKILGKKTGAFEAVVTDDPRQLLGDALPRYDALVTNNLHEREPFLPADFNQLGPEEKEAAKKMDAAIKQSILDYVKGVTRRNGKEVPGKGIVGIHAATAALQKWPAYGEMMGGFYGGHIYQDLVLEVEDPDHPVVACLEGEPWEIHDEIYFLRGPHDPDRLRILLSLDLDRMKDPGKREDGRYAISYVRSFGRGRVFYTTLGHDPRTYSNPTFLRHVLAGIQFAIGDLSAETAPNPQ